MRRIVKENINSEKYWDRAYASGRSGAEEGVDWLKNSIIANHIVDTSRVIELGCGAGWLLSRIATEKPHCKLFGVEHADAAIEILKKDKRIEVIKADITQPDFLPEERESFDYVICCEVLEHLEKPGELIKEMSRLLTKGGTLILTTPWGDHIPSPEHVWEFATDDIEEMMEPHFSQYWVYPWSSGLEVHEVKSGRLVYPPGHLDVIWAIGIK